MFDVKTLTVAELTAHIRHLLDRDEALHSVWVQGEVSNMKAASSGHWYFTLKDGKAQLKCVMWRSSTAKQNTIPRDGDAVMVRGRVAVYEEQGAYQLYAEELRPVGVGDLYAQFERLKARLEAEGLFDLARKRPLPSFPHKIGVVTSPTAAAFQDIQNVLRRRFPLVEIILSPTLVQGEEAPAQIVSAIRRINTRHDVDVILLIRGGGSIEDLWCFNDERVARAVAASTIPIISGVGHETDFTIADFVADFRAPTPSAAAEIATPDIADLVAGVGWNTERLRTLMNDKRSEMQRGLAGLERNLGYLSPANTIRSARQQVDSLSIRMSAAQVRRISLLRERVSSKASALNAANPKALLERGYALVTRTEDGIRVISADQKPGTGITITLKDGELKARIEDKDSHERYKRTLF